MKLGEGTYGMIYKKGDRAVKNFKDVDEDGENKYIVETTMCKYLTNNYTIRCLSYNFFNFSFEMELGIPVKTFIDNNPKFLRPIIDSFIGSVNYMHNHGILHLDIKPDNMVIVDNRVKLIDFGLSTYISNEFISSDSAITSLYRPPELFVTDCPSHPSLDIWSVGITILELVTKENIIRKLYDQLNNFVKIFLNYGSQLVDISFQNFDIKNKDYYIQLTNKMLKMDPNERQLGPILKFNIPFELIKMQTPYDIIISDSIGWLISVLKIYSTVHTIYLASKLFYQTLPPDLENNKIQVWLAACMKISDIVTNFDPALTYKRIYKHSQGVASETITKNFISRILEKLNYDVRSNDSYLYLNEKIVKMVADSSQYEEDMDNFYMLMSYQPKLFEIEPEILFKAYQAINNGEVLDQEQRQICQLLIQTLNNFDLLYKKNTDHAFSPIFRDKLNKYK